MAILILLSILKNKKKFRTIGQTGQARCSMRPTFLKKVFINSKTTQLDRALAFAQEAHELVQRVLTAARVHVQFLQRWRWRRGLRSRQCRVCGGPTDGQGDEFGCSHGGQ